MHEVAGENGFGARPDKGENDADARQSEDVGPSPAELRAMHEAKERSCKKDGRPDAEPSRECRIEIAAKDSLFDERRNQDRHPHEGKSHSGILHDFLDGSVVGSLGSGGRDQNDERESKTKKDVLPGVRRSLFVLRIEFSPTERGPEGVVVKSPKSDDQKKKQNRIPHNHAADGERGSGKSKLLKLLLGHVLREFFGGDVIGGESALNKNEGHDGEEHGADEMSPGPWDLEIAGSGRGEVVRLRVLGAVGERIAGRNF